MTDTPDPTAQAGEYEAVLDALEARESFQSGDDFLAVMAGEIVSYYDPNVTWKTVTLPAGSYAHIDVYLTGDGGHGNYETPEDRAVRERSETLARALKASR